MTLYETCLRKKSLTTVEQFRSEKNVFLHILRIQLYFHGAMEVPDISKQRYTFYESDYTTVELVALEILTNEDVKK